MKAYTFQDFYIPERMMPAIENYITKGINPGHFLTAVICNDFKEAVGRADDENMKNLPAYASYFYHEVPANCWGSKDLFLDWMKKKREEREAVA